MAVGHVEGQDARLLGSGETVGRAGKEGRLLRFRHEDSGMRTQVPVQRTRPALHRTDDEQVRVAGLSSEIAPAIWGAAQETKTAIQNLTPSQSSLEQVFLNAVKEKRHANS